MIHILGMGLVEQQLSGMGLRLALRRSAQFCLTAVLLHLLRRSVPFHHLLPHIDEPSVVLRLGEGGADRL